MFILSEGLTTIGYYAFAQCTSLLKITIPNSVARVGQDAFRECSPNLEATYKGVVYRTRESLPFALNDSTIGKTFYDLEFAFYNAVNNPS
jgi:hypothetical protein